MGAQIGWTHLEAPNGYTLIPNPLLKKLFSAKLPEAAYSVFLALASRRNLYFHKASTKDLARFLGRDRRTVEKALLALWEEGLVERDATGWWLSEAPTLQDLQAPVHAVQTPLQALQGAGEENALQNGPSSAREIKKKETTTEEKDPPHPHTLAAEAEEAGMDLEAPEEEGVLAASSSGDGGRAASPAPLPSANPPSPKEVPRALVNDGTKYRLQEALKRAGLWRDFYCVFRPGFAHQALWRAYLERLEREALPLGEAFLQALARTLEGAARGVVRYPGAYLDRLLQDLAPPEPPSPPPSPPLDRDVPQDALLLLPDGRRGYFAGWTGGGAKAFVEVDGVAYLVDRELVLQARVLG